MAQPKAKVTKNQSPKHTDIHPSIFTAFFRSLQLGITNFWRNKFLSLATILVIAVILFIFNVILTVNFIGNQGLKTLSERVDIIVYLRDDISEYETKNLTDNLQQVSGVKTVKYTSKEEALEIVAKTHPKTAEFLKKFNLSNPLPPSISIITEKPEDYTNVEAFLERAEYKPLLKNYVAGSSNQESEVLSSVAQNLINISHFIRQVIFWLVLIFIIGGTLVVLNAIQLTIYTRRKEIQIMQLVGATPWFIRLPFIFEGILYGIFAVVFSFIFMFLLSKTIQIENTTIWNYYNMMEFNKIFIAELGITIILGTISSFTAVEQYIKGKFLSR